MNLAFFFLLFFFGYPFISTFSQAYVSQQVRDLEQQLKEQRQPSVQSIEGESLSSVLLQRTPPREKNLSHIRNIRKEKREALEVHFLLFSFQYKSTEM